MYLDSTVLAGAMAETVGMNVLLKDTGEKARTLQHWADLGIIRAEEDTDKRGRGRYRAFVVEPHFGERKWALIASELVKLNIPMWEIRKILDILRPYADPFSGAYVYSDDNGKVSENTYRKRFEEQFFYQALYEEKLVMMLFSLNRTNEKSLGVFFHIIGPYDYEIFKPEKFKENNFVAVQYFKNASDFWDQHPQGHFINLTHALDPLFMR